MLQTQPVRLEDEPFLLRLYAASRRAEVSAWGWDESQQDGFLRMQFHARIRSYSWQYPEAEHLIILQDGQPVGQIMVDRSGEALRLVDVTLLEQHQGHGTGTALVRQLQREAAEADKPLRLHVEKGSRARSLYERLGFTVTAEGDVYDAMEWVPGT